MEHEVYLILGSNIEPDKNIHQAVEKLGVSLNLVTSSSLWRTQPIGMTGPDFLNLALLVNTSFDMDELKEKILCRIEEELGRVRTTNKFSDRPIDIDIVIFDGILIEPNLGTYDYLILPFSELIPSFTPVKGLDDLGELAKKIRPHSKAVMESKFDLPLQRKKL